MVEEKTLKDRCHVVRYEDNTDFVGIKVDGEFIPKPEPGEDEKEYKAKRDKIVLNSKPDEESDVVSVTADEGKENSIITAIAENDKRYAQRLRNNKPLYKRE